jgi:hypothetical protein
VILKLILLRLIKRKVKKAMLKKLLEGAGITGLIVGAISAVSGVDIAPQDVDVLVTAASIVATVGPAIVVGIKNKFFKAKE